MEVPGANADLGRLAAELAECRARMDAAAEARLLEIDACDPEHRASAINLLHYAALRSADLRPLQEQTRRLGLSSLGRCEGCVMASVTALEVALARLSAQPAPPVFPHPPIGFTEADRLLARNTDALLGPARAARPVRIMVTLPAEAADDPRVSAELRASGMDVARINGAHGDPDRWARMVEHLRRTDGPATGRCRVFVDLPGPKLRTGPIAGKKGYIRVRPGDRVRLCGPGDAPAPTGTPLAVTCDTPGALDAARPGHRVWFDDGKIGTTVIGREPHGLVLEVTHARPSGEKLRPAKGINTPDTELDLPAIGPPDEAALAFAAAHADMVGLSFVRRASDVREVRERLVARGAPSVGIVLKIESRRSFDRLPELILAALGSPTAGVMIARGDLAVEVGYERLAEAQEESLWFCEAAHLPVIWATQVLESLAKRGRATRAEITDAAMAHRAECVMLNKGPYIAHAVRTLDDILRRMGAHQFKKRAMLRPLDVARRALTPDHAPQPEPAPCPTPT